MVRFSSDSHKTQYSLTHKASHFRFPHTAISLRKLIGKKKIDNETYASSRSNKWSSKQKDHLSKPIMIRKVVNLSSSNSSRIILSLSWLLRSPLLRSKNDPNMEPGNCTFSVSSPLFRNVHHCENRMCQSQDACIFQNNCLRCWGEKLFLRCFNKQ